MPDAGISISRFRRDLAPGSRLLSRSKRLGGYFFFKIVNALCWYQDGLMLYAGNLDF